MPNAGETPIARTNKFVRVRLLEAVGDDPTINKITDQKNTDRGRIPAGAIVEIDTAVEVHWTANKICKRTKPGATR